MLSNDSAVRPGLLAAGCLAAALLGACGSEPDAVTPPPPAAPSAPAASSTAGAPRPLPPLPGTPTSAPEPSGDVQPPPAAEDDAPPPAGSCGTVTAASGLTLQVLGEDSGAVPCEQAKQLVERFHAAIAGRQSADSNEPVSQPVDGWLCVSGPPAAQGGTSCGKGEQNVLAAVVPAE